MVTLHNISNLNMKTLNLRGLKSEMPTVEFIDTTITPNVKRKITNGSTYTAIDEDVKYMYDEASEQWYVNTSSGGGGGDAQTASDADIEDLIDNIWS